MKETHSHHKHYEIKNHTADVIHVYKTAQIHHIDALAEQRGLSPVTLMENAGRAIYEVVQSLVNREQSIVILAGRGNNGGDGIVLARYLQQANYDVMLCFPLGEPKTVVAQKHLAYYNACSFHVTAWNETIKGDVIIDALLGVGAKLPLRKNVATIVAWANKQKAVRMAIDVPTGVNSDTGDVEDENNIEPFFADFTIALHGAKPSAFLFPSLNYYGTLHVIPIGLPQTSNVKLINQTTVSCTLPRRELASHKGTFGMGMIVAGTKEMPGSAALAAIGAIRSGIGRLVVATEGTVIPTFTTHGPDAPIIPT